MKINKRDLYRFPWSKTDNPGGWIEVTDECDMSCKGCYRHQISGHRPIEDIKKDVLAIKESTNCDFITIAGGEPLIYPKITEVVKFISEQKLKPLIFTNGEKFTREMGLELKSAGLSKIHFHVDSGQDRPGWEGKTEEELNVLRQKFADLIWGLKGIQCGFNVTVYRPGLKYVTHIIDWCMNNLHKVQHISFIAFRGISLNEDLDFYANGKRINLSSLNNTTSDPTEINITTEEIYELIKKDHSNLDACAYLNGTSQYDTFKFLIIVNVGTRKMHYGVLSKKTTEFAQVFYHLFFGRYFAFLGKSAIGKKIFLLFFMDKKIRQAFTQFCKACLRNPLRLFDRVYLQSIHIQQPNEIINGQNNLCDDCVNMMIYDGKLIKPCQMDEYRLYGGPLVIMNRPVSQIKENEPMS